MIENNSQAAVFQPVSSHDRIAIVDAVRGMALLGILIINIDFFAYPMSIMFNPSTIGGFEGINLITWEFGYLFFFEKMMAIFSMLFGGGLILMMDRSQKSSLKFGKFYYRRLMWLLIISLIHGYLFWYGDILFPYAICGMIIFLFRRRSPRLLIIIGICFLLFGAALYSLGGVGNAYLRDEAVAAQATLDEGKSIKTHQQEMINNWEMVQSIFGGTEENLQEEINAYQGDFSEILDYRIPATAMMQTQAFFFMIIWRVLGIMLIGMGLMKAGFLTGQRSSKTYLIWTIIGYGAGLPVVFYGMSSSLSHAFDFIRYLTYGSHFNYLASILVALGHASLLILLYKRGILKGLMVRLGAVGRMALSNYLFHTLFFTTIFYGYGFGLFGKIDRFPLLLMVIGMWIFQLIYSPIWLRHFNYGPVEWLWRSLTYWKRQPMRIGK